MKNDVAEKQELKNSEAVACDGVKAVATALGIPGHIIPSPGEYQPIDHTPLYAFECAKEVLQNGPANIPDGVGGFLEKPTIFEPGKPCDHPGCLSHVTHRCEGCGRINGQWEYVQNGSQELSNQSLRVFLSEIAEFSEPDTPGLCEPVNLCKINTWARNALGKLTWALGGYQSACSSQSVCSSPNPRPHLNRYKLAKAALDQLSGDLSHSNVAEAKEILKKILNITESEVGSK